MILVSEIATAGTERMTAEEDHFMTGAIGACFFAHMSWESKETPPNATATPQGIGP